MTGTLTQLAATFARLGVLAVGGVNSVVPEMQREVVGVRHWMSARQFADLFALAQAAPGPNMLVATLVGWKVAGAAGAAVATASLIGPTSTLTWATARFWHRHQAARWRSVVQAGLTPVTVGLVLAASLLLARAAVRDLGGVLVVLAAAACAFGTRLHPLWLLAAGAALGALGLA